MIIEIKSKTYGVEWGAVGKDHRNKMTKFGRLGLLGKDHQASKRVRCNCCHQPVLAPDSQKHFWGLVRD